MAAKIGVAFDVSADQAGKAMANLKNSLKLSLGETGLLADAMNFLSNKMAASAQQVLDVTLRVGAQGKQFGLGAKEVAAFGGAMVAAGAQSEIASTSLRNLGLKLTKGEAATTAQRKALADLGLEAVNVAKAMQVDAAGTILDVFERIGALPDFRRASVSSMLLGDETRALGPLITNIGLLSQALALVQNESDYAGSAMREYERQAATSANQLQISRNGLTETAIIIGTVLLPALNEASAQFNKLTGALSAFAEKNPELSSGLVKTAAGLVALSVAGRVVSFLFSGLRALAVPAFAAIAAAGWPVVTVGAAIAAAGLLLLQYWKPVRAFFTGLAEGLGLNELLDQLVPLGETIADVFSPMGKAIGGVVDWFGKLIQPLAATKAEFESTRALGVQLGQALVKTFTRPLDALGNLLASIGSLGNEIIKAFTGIDLAAEGGRILTSLWDGMKAVWAEFKAWLGRIAPSISGAFSFKLPSLSDWFGGGDKTNGTPAAARGSGVGSQAPVINYDNNPRIAVNAQVTVNNTSNAATARDAGRAVEQRVRRALDDAAVAMP